MWYAAFIIGIAVIVITTSIGIYKMQERNNIKVGLMEEVTDSFDEVEKTANGYVFDDDMVFYEDGVYISYYEEDGTLIGGKFPDKIGDLPEFADEELTTIQNKDGEDWYIYDTNCEVGEWEFWVRGITKGNSLMVENKIIQTTTILFMIVLVILANVGGWLITKRAYKPVDDIINTVNEISMDADVSRRLKLGKHRDELYKLSDTFNKMLDKIEGVLKKEKQFTSDVSHELKTPLAIINSQSKFAMEDESFQKEAIESIYEESERMSRIVSNLLTLSRSDEGRLKVDMEDVPLSDICEKLAEQQEMILARQGIEVLHDIEPEIHVAGDEIMLVRMMLNLLENARKYGCGENSNKIKLSLKSQNDEALISVSDWGGAIPENILDKIWDRFYRADKSRTDAESSGLGLPIVKAIAEVHGGKVEVSSDNEQTVFTVSIPKIK